MIDINAYNSSTGQLVSNITYPNHAIASPSETDYKNGYVVRYFIQKINTKEIFETSADSYETTNGILFNKIQFNWIIAGSQHNIIQNSVVIRRGVYETNRQTIKDVDTMMDGIKKYLTDYLQYYK
jgi:hypothetical protein